MVVIGFVLVIAQLSVIYGSKPTESEGDSPRTRFVYVAINPWQLYYKYYISLEAVEQRTWFVGTAMYLIGPQHSLGYEGWLPTSYILRSSLRSYCCTESKVCILCALLCTSCQTHKGLTSNPTHSRWTLVLSSNKQKMNLWRSTSVGYQCSDFPNCTVQLYTCQHFTVTSKLIAELEESTAPWIYYF